MVVAEPLASGRRLVAVATVSLAALTGCAGLGEERGTTAVAGLQSLYRLEVRTGSDSFSGRLILRERGASWEAAVADGLGREVWAWRVHGEQTAWIDATRGTWCPDWGGGESQALPPDFDGETLRRVLHGQLPDPTVELGDGNFTVRRTGGVWSGTAAGGQPSRWRFDRGAELVWSWEGDARRGSLVSGNGFAMDWVRVVIEPLSARFGFGPLTPTGVVRDCSPAGLQ